MISTWPANIFLKDKYVFNDEVLVMQSILSGRLHDPAYFKLNEDGGVFVVIK